MHLAHVLPGDIPSVWPTVEPLLDEACARPGCDHTTETLRALLLKVEGVLWLVLDDEERITAAGVLQVRAYESGRLPCWVLALGGTGSGAWRDVIAAVEAGARLAGCSGVEFIGRPAWRRLLPDYHAVPCEAGFHFSRQMEQ